MTDKQEILERQHEEGNPLLDIFKGAVAIMEKAKANLTTCEPDGLASSLGEITEFLKAISENCLSECMIVKVQKPLSYSGPMKDAPYLLYNEDRSLMDQIVLNDPSIVELFGDDPKMYVNARLWVDGTLQIVDRTDDQDW